MSQILRQQSNQESPTSRSKISENELVYAKAKNGPMVPAKGTAQIFQHTQQPQNGFGARISAPYTRMGSESKNSILVELTEPEEQPNYTKQLGHLMLYRDNTKNSWFREILIKQNIMVPREWTGDQCSIEEGYMMDSRLEYEVQSFLNDIWLNHPELVLEFFLCELISKTIERKMFKETIFMLELLGYPHFFYYTDVNGTVQTMDSLIFAATIQFQHYKLVRYLLQQVYKGKITISVQEAIIIYSNNKFSKHEKQ